MAGSCKHIEYGLDYGGRMIEMIVITAPTSKIGRQVLERIFENGEEIRVIGRDPERISEAIRERVEVIQGTHTELESSTGRSRELML
jgi:short-subunit dehydrogenase involved in D-alanine esterification of teichoic acids